MGDLDLKYKISQLYERSLFLERESHEIHPVRIVQSVKSIIGINHSNPLKNLLQFCDEYLDTFNIREFKSEDFPETPEVITFSDFELALKNKDFDRASKSVCSLMKVSDSKHILEFLLEFSVKYDLDCFMNIWSVYKMMLFLNGEGILNSIFFCIDQIISEDKKMELNIIDVHEFDLNQYEYNEDDFLLFMTSCSIINEDLVRKENIVKYIKSNINKKIDFKSPEVNSGKDGSFIDRKRMWINEFAGSLDKNFINSNLLLTLEACRGVLKVCAIEQKEIIWSNLNKYLESNGFK